MPVSLEVRGDIEARDKLTQVQRDLNGRPFMDSMRQATLIVESAAKRNVNVDVGRLRGSIASEVRTVPGAGGGANVQGVVGSNVKYAAAHELGSRPHWVPIRALEKWAKRKGLSAYAVQRSIARKGTKAHPYLVPAFEQNRGRIVAILGRGVSAIVRK